MVDRQKLKKRKARLFETQSGLCYYCGIKMSMDNYPNSNFATIEHLYCRGDIRRLCQKKLGIVLACKKCNCERPNEFKPQYIYEPFDIRNWICSM